MQSQFHIVCRSPIPSYLEKVVLPLVGVLAETICHLEDGALGYIATLGKWSLSQLNEDGRRLHARYSKTLSRLGDQGHSSATQPQHVRFSKSAGLRDFRGWGNGWGNWQGTGGLLP